MAHERKGEGSGLQSGGPDVIAGITEAEASSVRDISEARESKDARIEKAQAKARETREKAAGEAEAAKAKVLADARKEFSAEADALLAAAKKDEESVRRKKVDARMIDSAFSKLLEELDA